MQQNIPVIHSLNQLNHLPRFAGFIRHQHLQQYVQVQQQIAQTLPVSLQQLLGVSSEDVPAAALQMADELFCYLEQNEVEKQIQVFVEKWSQSRLLFKDNDSVASENIAQVLYIFKASMLAFIEEFSTGTSQALALVAEIDFYCVKLEEAALGEFARLLQQKIEQQSHLTHTITNTSPGIIYLFDMRTQSVLFANKTAEDFFGISLPEAQQMGNEILPRLLHPDDYAPTLQFLSELSNTQENDVHTLEFRMRSKDGNYVWMRNYCSLFTQNGEEVPAKIIGNIINIQSEKEFASQLQQSEERYRQAERLTHIGNYEWDFETNLLSWSEELYRIYGLTPQTEPLTFETAARFNHPDDTAHINEAIAVARKTKQPYDFYYRIITADQSIKILHARGNVLTNKENEPIKIIGTVQDETEKQNLIQRLEFSEEVYKQAEKMANMGNWSLNVKTNELKWTDQLYLIYGLEPQSEEITVERFLSFVHPEDRPAIEQSVQNEFSEESLDYTFRIITQQGEEKTLRSIAQAWRDDDGSLLLVVGTEQDITEQQNLLRQLKHNEMLYKQAEAIAHIGNWWHNVQTGEVYWSDELYNIYELPNTEVMTYESVLNFTHPDDRQKAEEALQESIRNKKPFDKVSRIVLHSGKTKIIHRRAEVVSDPAGNTLLLIGTSQDVTEQYRVQQELKDNQTFIRKIADATPSIIASYNVNTGQYAFVSEGIRKLLGYDPDRALKEGIQFFMEIIHPDDVERLIQKNTEALEEANNHPEKNDMVVEFIYRMRHQNGNYHWFHTYGTIFDRNDKGMVEQVLNISLDITEQREASKKIEEQEQFIKNIADASPTILYVFDVQKESFAYVNHEIYFVMGYTPEEILEMGSNATDHLYHPDDFHLLPERRQSDRRIVESDIMIQYECRMKARNGEWQWFLVREVVFRTDENGQPLQIVGAALDISKRKEMERTLLQNSFMLEQSNASLEEFAYVASHDLKEPLRKISTFGDRLMTTQADKLAPEGKIYLNKIVDASQRMQTMISDLLSISMISGNKAFEPYSLQKVLDETLQTLEYKVEQKNALVESDGLPVANIVPSQFRQLFQNLLSNSMKFIQPDVQPKITIRHQYLSPQDVNSFQINAATRYLQVEFSDNGIGFENEFAGKIFLIFQRLHGRSEYEGSGIGLAICKKIVEHHGGIIYASGEPEKGATFTIILPA